MKVCGNYRKENGKEIKLKKLMKEKSAIQKEENQRTSEGRKGKKINIEKKKEKNIIQHMEKGRNEGQN